MAAKKDIKTRPTTMLASKSLDNKYHRNRRKTVSVGDKMTTFLFSKPIIPQLRIVHNHIANWKQIVLILYTSISNFNISKSNR